LAKLILKKMLAVYVVAVSIKVLSALTILMGVLVVCVMIMEE